MSIIFNVAVKQWQPAKFVGGVVVGTAVIGYLAEWGTDGPGSSATLSGVVTVARRTPTCTCGWMGRRRVALFLARHDAWMHAAAGGCLPGVPFVAQR
jgi:hypothetical protein